MNWGTADLFLQQTFSFSKTFACISALQRLIQMNETRPGKSFVSYCNQLVGLFQVSRQQTGLVQRLSGVLWFLRVYEEDGETASIALYDFIWHCQQRLLNRPLQLVVVFRWENPNNDQVVQILPSLSHILALRGFVWKYLSSVTKDSFDKETSAVHWYSCFGGNCKWATQEEFKYFPTDVKTKILRHFGSMCRLSIMTMKKARMPRIKRNDNNDSNYPAVTNDDVDDDDDDDDDGELCSSCSWHKLFTFWRPHWVTPEVTLHIVTAC